MNILLITVDQQIAASLDADFPVQLPNIERLKRRGVHFTQAYTPHAQCTPARASLLTGLLPHAHGMFNNCHNSARLRDNLDTSIPTYTRALQENGYVVGQVGKWHISNTTSPTEYGVDDVVPARGERHTVTDPILVKEKIAGGEIMSGVVDGDEDRFHEHRVATGTIDLMRRYHAESKPWHIRAEFSGPHVSWIVPRRFSALVAPDEISLPKNFSEDFRGKPVLQWRQHRNANLCSCFHDEKWLKANLVRYYGYIAFIDEQIGRVLDEIESLGAENDTMIVFAADHGELAGAHNRIGKGEFGYDELIRIPMIVAWPGVLETGVSDEFIMFHDLNPIMFAAANVDVPDGLHAQCVIGRDGTIRGRDFVLTEHHGTMQPVVIRVFRDRNYKYVFNPFETDEFYDLERDPAELENRIDDPECAELVASYRAKILRALEDVNDKWYPAARQFLSEQSIRDQEPQPWL